MSVSLEDCLGGLINELDMDDSISNSKPGPNEENVKSPKSLQNSFFPNNEGFSSTDINSAKANLNLTGNNNMFESRYLNNMGILLTKESIINSFSSQKSTILLQKTLREFDSNSINHIVNTISGSFSEIMKDKNGNYFCSDLFKACTLAQRIKIIQEIKDSIYEICLNEYGTHPIQTLFELSSSKIEYHLLISCFNDINKILQASLNPNGSYVIQKLISHTPEVFRENFNVMLLKIVSLLYFNMYGVCIVKKFMSCTKNEFIINQILDLISKNLIYISRDQYGNYLIQFILQNWWINPKILIIKKKIVSNFYYLASEKFSSHICDLFIELSDYKEKLFLMSLLINSGYFGFLSKNKFGYYVINKLMKSLSISGNNCLFNNNLFNKNKAQSN